MSSSDFLIGAPKFITNRFNSIHKYVSETLLPERTKRERLRRKRSKSEKIEELSRLKSIIDEASTIVFLFLINKFFIDGANAAKQAVDTFKELDVEGFFIGRSYFSERNEKVVQGDKISEQLLASIEDVRAKKMITESKYISEIIREYKKLI